MSANLHDVAPPRNYLFSFYHELIKRFAIGERLPEVWRHQVWRPGIYHEDEVFLFADYIVVHVPQPRVPEVNFQLRDYRRILAMNGLVCLPLADTVFNLKKYEKIGRMTADIIGGKCLGPFTEILPQEFYAIESQGMEIGVL